MTRRRRETRERATREEATSRAKLIPPPPDPLIDRVELALERAETLRDYFAEAAVRIRSALDPSGGAASWEVKIGRPIPRGLFNELARCQMRQDAIGEAAVMRQIELARGSSSQKDQEARFDRLLATQEGASSDSGRLQVAGKTNRSNRDALVAATSLIVDRVFRVYESIEPAEREYPRMRRHLLEALDDSVARGGIHENIDWTEVAVLAMGAFRARYPEAGDGLDLSDWRAAAKTWARPLGRPRRGARPPWADCSLVAAIEEPERTELDRWKFLALFMAEAGLGAISAAGLRSMFGGRPK